MKFKMEEKEGHFYFNKSVSGTDHFCHYVSYRKFSI